MGKILSGIIRGSWEAIQVGFVRLIEPMTKYFIRVEINPNILTTIGFCVSIFAGYSFAIGLIRLGAVLVLLSGIFDIMDGKIARGSNQVTKFGALYDSTLDRYAEIVVFLGITYYFIGKGMLYTSLMCCIALGGSLMVSYVRARAEGLGFSCKVGLLQRSERIVILGASALIHEYALIVGVIILAVFANFTAIQRIYYIWQQENGKKHELVRDFDKRG